MRTISTSKTRIEDVEEDTSISRLQWGGGGGEGADMRRTREAPDNN